MVEGAAASEETNLPRPILFLRKQKEARENPLKAKLSHTRKTLDCQKV